jgi:8-oxo-dGTP pyrophosphatase MutT (NUDIX family)
MMKYLLTLAYHANRLRCFLLRPMGLSVKLLLVQEGQVVLVQHSYQPGWHLPGGGVKRGETLEQAARREAREELGATLTDLRFWSIYTAFHEFKSDHLALFVSEDFTLTGESDAEIERIEWFPLEQLPEDLGRSSLRRVDEFRRGHAPGAGRW